jgi:hypothetical protein
MTFFLAGTPKVSRATKQNKEEFADQLGKQITLVGEAQNLKEGSLLAGKNFSIFIDSLESWPNEFAFKKVVVTGVVIERHDLPVYIKRPGSLPQAGIAVPPGTDLHKAAHRYLLKDAKWKLQ